MLWWKSRNPCYDGQIKRFVASFLYRKKKFNVWWCQEWQMISYWRIRSDEWKVRKGVYIVQKNNVMTLETVITSWPGSCPTTIKYGDTFNWEQTFCCYKRRSQRQLFLTWMCFVVLSQGNLCSARQRGQPLLDSFENLCCLVRDCEWVGTGSKNRYSFCKLLESISDNFFQTIDVIYFKTVISLRLAWSEIYALTLLRLCKVDEKTRRCSERSHDCVEAMSPLSFLLCPHMHPQTCSLST